MTCIVGFLDKKNDCVWIGGDSLGSNGEIKFKALNNKVFRSSDRSDVIIGGTTSFRHLDLLEYTDGLFDKMPLKNVSRKEVVTKFIPEIRTLFTDCVEDKEDVATKGANFIIGIGNQMFEVQPDYSVMDLSNGMCVVGCGEEVAMGSLITTQNLGIPPEKRIELALMAAEEYSCGVERPFTILNTKDDTVITIE